MEKKICMEDESVRVKVHGFHLKVVVLFICVGLTQFAFSRSYKFRLLRGTAETSSSSYYYSNSTVKKDSFLVEIGADSKTNSLEVIEIRAATLLKQVSSKKSVINDVAVLKFKPTGRRQQFVVECGGAKSDYSGGYIKGGVIIELWQSGKCLKHWSSATGSLSKTKLTSDTKCAYINASGYESSQMSFNNATTIVEQGDLDLNDKTAIENDGKKVYYVIRDVSYITDEDREYAFLRLDKEDAEDTRFRPRIFKKRLSKEEVEELKTIYAHSKVFDTLDELKDFLRHGKSQLPGAEKPIVYVVRDAEKVSVYDRRMVFENLSEGSYNRNFGNVLVRRFSQQDISDFKLINPRCKVFESLDDLKAFMRTVKIIDAQDPPISRNVTLREVSSSPAESPSAETAPARKQLTMEELDARIKADMEHEKEMLRRKLGE